MNRRTALMSAAVLSLAACAFPQASFAQTNPLIGSWKLDLTKSKYPSGSAPRSQMVTNQPDGQNIKATFQTIDAQGNGQTIVFTIVYDGQPHPVTGVPRYDAVAYLQLDGTTTIFSATKAGKLVLTGAGVVSQDGKSMTLTGSGMQANGSMGTIISVYEKQ
jgi:hypothetical protein